MEHLIITWGTFAHGGLHSHYIELPIIAGIIASILHVVSGPDHLAAITPFAVENKRKVWKIGFSWGMGHLVGMLMIGMLFILFKNIVPVEKISEYSEQIVAVVLIGVGFWALYRIVIKEKKHNRPHVHADSKVFIHQHEEEHIVDNKHTASSVSEKTIISSFVIGVIHGLAGIAHFLLLSPALSYATKSESYLYIGGFAIGTVMAMTVYAYLLGSIAKKSSGNKSLLKTIRLIGGLFALIVGVYWLYLSL